MSDLAASGTAIWQASSLLVLDSGHDGKHFLVAGFHTD